MVNQIFAKKKRSKSDTIYKNVVILTICDLLNAVVFCGENKEKN